MSNLSRARKHTVRMTKDGELRIGQDLLGQLAGRRDLCFTVARVGQFLVFAPQIHPCSLWRAVYHNAAAKSPYVRMRTILKFWGMPRDIIPVGEHPVKLNRRKEILLRIGRY